MAIPVRWSRKIAISYIAGIALLALFLRNTDWKAISTGVRSVALPMLLAAIALRIASLIASSIRWRYLLLPVRKVRLLSLIAAMMIGMAVNTGVSMQAAEFVRPYVLSRHEKIDFSSTMSTVVVEWFLDLLAILALFIPALIWMRSGGGGSSAPKIAGMDKAILILLLLSSLGLVALWTLHRYSAPLEAYFAGPQTRLSPKIGRLISEQLHHFSIGLEVLRRPRDLVAVSVLSLITSSLTALSCWAALNAFGLVLPPVASFIVLGIISIGGVIPTPGAVGGFHAICQFGLVMFFKLESAATVLPVIGLHAVLYIPASIIGLFCIFDYGRDGTRALT